MRISSKRCPDPRGSASNRAAFGGTARWRPRLQYPIRPWRSRSMHLRSCLAAARDSAAREAPEVEYVYVKLAEPADKAPALQRIRWQRDEFAYGDLF